MLYAVCCMLRAVASFPGSLAVRPSSSPALQACPRKGITSQPSVLQVTATSAPLQDCSVLRWSRFGRVLAVPGLNAVKLLKAEDLAQLTSFLFSFCNAHLDCAWLPGTSQLAVWGPTPSDGRFQRFCVVSLAAPHLLVQVALTAVVRKPQWGLDLLAATADDGSLLLFSTAPGSQQPLASLPAALPVGGHAKAWCGLCTYSFNPVVGRYLAVVLAPSSPASDLTLVLLDGYTAGAVVWSYTLRETGRTHGVQRGWAAQGVHHLIWAAEGSALSCSISAGFLRRFHLSFEQDMLQGPCERSCNGALFNACPEFGHVRPSSAELQDRGMIQDLSLFD